MVIFEVAVSGAVELCCVLTGVSIILSTPFISVARLNDRNTSLYSAVQFVITINCIFQSD